MDAREESNPRPMRILALSVVLGIVTGLPFSLAVLGLFAGSVVGIGIWIAMDS